MIQNPACPTAGHRHCFILPRGRAWPMGRPQMAAQSTRRGDRTCPPFLLRDGFATISPEGFFGLLRHDFECRQLPLASPMAELWRICAGEP